MPHNEFKVQCTLSKRTLNLGTLRVKPLVSHTVCLQKSLAKSRYPTLCMPLSPVPGPSSSSSARPELCAAAS